MRERGSASQLVGRRPAKGFPARSHATIEPSSRNELVSPPGRAFVLNYAYKLLSYRGRSEKEMRQRLILKGFDEHAIDAVITVLTANGFLDDRKLASSLRRYAAESRHLGIRGTKSFLRDRGIPREIIEEAMHDIDESQTAEKIVEKMMRFADSHSPEKTTRRIYNALYRRGYSSETIRKILDKFALKENLQ